MSTPPSGSRPEGITSTHVLTSAGWVPLRPIRPDAPPPRLPGDLVNGRAFNGSAWLVVPPHPRPPALQDLSTLPPPSSPPPLIPRPIASTENRQSGPSGPQLLIIGAVIVSVVIAALIAIRVVNSRSAGPETQADFIAIVKRAQQTATANDTQVVQAKKIRGDGICEVLPSSRRVKDWEGTLTYISTELGGDQASITVRLAKGINLEADDGLFDTGIDPDTELFEKIANLEEGQQVTFAGQFGEGDYCIDEGNLTSEDGLRNPDFGFKFSDIRDAS